jgi:hypothetical protein
MFTVAMIAWSPQPGRDALVIAVSGVAGLVFESALVIAGLVRFSAPWPIEALAPAWIVALWIAFGASLPSIVDNLGRYPLKMGAALGAVAGPLAYLAGVRLGALQLVGSTTLGLLVISGAWAAVMAGLVAFRARLDQ